MNKTTTLAITILLAITTLFSCNNNEKATGQLSSEINSTLSSENTQLASSQDIESNPSSVIIYGQGGPAEFMFEAEYCYDFYSVNNEFSKLIGGEKVFNEWTNQFECFNVNGKRKAKEFTILTFIKEFNIRKADFKKVLDEIAKNNVYIYSDQQVNALFSYKQDEIDKNMVNPIAILHNNKIYTPEWFATHTAQDYKKEGIPFKVIQSKMAQWQAEKVFEGTYIKDGQEVPRGNIAELEQNISALQVNEIAQ